MIYCQVCGADNEDRSVFCANCGTSIFPAQRNPMKQSLRPENIRKENLIFNNQQSMVFSPEYTENGFYDSSISDKSGSVALILCLFLGILGAHRFYAGRYGSGLFYVFTAGFFVIGSIIDLVNILTNRFTDNYGRVMRL